VLIIQLLQLRTIVKAVRSSPQQRQLWFIELHAALERSQASQGTSENQPPTQTSKEREKMLILDVVTRWNTTHDMLGKRCLIDNVRVY
jgi:hypothetical protein